MTTVDGAHPNQLRHSRLREAPQEFWQSDRSLSALLIFLLFTVFIAGPLSDIGVIGHFVLALVFTLVLVSGAIAVAKSRLAAIMFSAVAIGTLVTHWVRFANRTPLLETLDAIGTLLACGLLAGIVLVQVLREGPITIHRIQGAIAVYLLLGVVWAALFGLVYINDPTSMNFGGVVPSSDLIVLRTRLVYFSFTTLTTVGYGDITPVSPVARSLAMLEAMTGQLFPAILIARLVSMELYYRQRSFEREQAALDRQAIAREIARLVREND
jgi:hypothetical protein